MLESKSSALPTWRRPKKYFNVKILYPFSYSADCSRVCQLLYKYFALSHKKEYLKIHKELPFYMQRIKHPNDIKRPLRAVYCAICGLKSVFKDEIAFKQEVLLSIAVIPLALIFGITAVEKAILIGSWFLVLLVEIINSAIEAVVDRVSLEFHPLSKKCKDIGAAAVLLSIMNAITIWTIILF
jgi:diacylglycerol kinase (ATP)